MERLKCGGRSKLHQCWPAVTVRIVTFLLNLVAKKKKKKLKIIKKSH